MQMNCDQLRDVSPTPDGKKFILSPFSLKLSSLITLKGSSENICELNKEINPNHEYKFGWQTNKSLNLGYLHTMCLVPRKLSLCFPVFGKMGTALSLHDNLKQNFQQMWDCLMVRSISGENKSLKNRKS